MGISSYLIVQQTEDIRTNKSLIVYAIQLVINFFWPVFFFGLKAYLFSFIWIILLIAAIITMTVLYCRQNKIAAYLQIPYILWTIFAAYLNLGVYILN
jgi:tryptophan-rich sensory protein